MLEGVRILDLTHRLAGPFATLLLAHMGAEVIKIEPPEGDLTRTGLPEVVPGVSEYFATYNLAKKHVGVNLRSPRGREAVLRLARVSDALIDNFRPGVLDRLGITSAELSEVNRHLVTVSISGFGPKGPYRDLPTLDPLVQSLSGLTSINGEPDGLPVISRIPIADLSGGLYGAIALLAGIIGRDRGHDCCNADISLLQGLQHLMGFVVTRWLNGGEPPKRLGAESEVVVPAGIFATKDGWLTITIRGEDYWQGFAKGMDRHDLLDDHRFDSNRQRIAHRAELNRIVAETLQSRTTKEWSERFAGLLVAPINTVPEAFENAHVQSTGGVLEIRERESRLRIVDTPIRWRGESSLASLPKAIGADTLDVLTGLAGYSEEEVRELAREGAVVIADQ